MKCHAELDALQAPLLCTAIRSIQSFPRRFLNRKERRERKKEVQKSLRSLRSLRLIVRLRLRRAGSSALSVVQLPLSGQQGPATVPDFRFSAYGQQRDLFISLVTNNAMRTRIKALFSIDTKKVMVVSMTQLDLSRPGAIRLALHRVGIRMPVIKIAHQGNMLRLRCDTNEVDRLGGVLCRVTSRTGGLRTSRIHLGEPLYIFTL
jgi:hypothetical protein